MRRAAWVALALLAGCTRSFVAPKADGGAAAPVLDPIDAPGGVFAGATLVLHGQGFSSAPAADQVRVGNAFAAVEADPAAGLPSATALQIVVPELGESAQDAQVTVTVGGLTSAPQSLHYRGPGHPSGFALLPGADLSPTPTDVGQFGGYRLISLLGNPSLVFSSAQYGFDLAYAVPAQSLPFEVRLAPQLTGPGESLAGYAGLLAFDGPSSRTELWSMLDLSDVQTGFASTTGALPLDANSFDPMHNFFPALTGDLLFQWNDQPVDDSAFPHGLLVQAPGGGGITLSDSYTEYGPDAGDGLAFLDTRVVVVGKQAGVSFALPLTVSPAAASDGGLRIGLRVEDAGLPVAVAASGLDGGGFLLVPSAISAEPGGRAAWVVGPQYGAAGSGATLVMAVPFDGGAAYPVGQPSVRRADGVVAARSHIALWSQFDTAVRLFDFDGQATAEVQLPGRPFRLRRAADDPSRYLAVLSSPPEIVEFDETGRVLSTQLLNNQLVLSSLNRAGDQIAAWAMHFPALTLLTTSTLSPGPFQQPAPERHFRNAYLAASTWRGAAGHEELCGLLVPLIGAQQVLWCGAAQSFFSSTAGCDELAGLRAAGASDDELQKSVQLAGLEDGRLRIYGATRVWECAGGCPASCSAVGDYGSGRAPQQLAVTPQGNALAYTNGPDGGDGQLALLRPPDAPQPLCSTSDPRCPIATPQEISAVAVDASEHYAIFVAHAGALYDLQAKQVVGRLLYLSDIPVAGALTPDGTRFYVGTLLGRLDEYEVSAGQPGTVLAPSRSVVITGGVKQILPTREGSRLVVTDLNDDRVYVVE